MAGGVAELVGRAQRVLDAAPYAWRGARGRLRGAVAFGASSRFLALNQLVAYVVGYVVYRFFGH